MGASASAPEILAILVAVGLDIAVGDPVNRLHPVAWFGRLIIAGRRRFCIGPPTRLFVSGAALTLAAAAVAAAAGWGVARLASHAGPAQPLVIGAALWLLLALRDLFAAALEVARLLAEGDLSGARSALAWHLVSRPTANLDADQVASGAVESVAENLTDSYAAPLAFFLVFGLPGAALYRAVNTADAMLGYREGPLEHFGKAAARLDDALNIVPARLAGLAIVAAAGLVGGNPRTAWRTLVRDRGVTASPNAGWTMSAAAGALEVTLEKPGAYRLGEGRPPGVADIRRSVALVAAAAALLTVLLVTLGVLLRTPFDPA